MDVLISFTIFISYLAPQLCSNQSCPQITEFMGLTKKERKKSLLDFQTLLSSFRVITMVDCETGNFDLGCCRSSNSPFIIMSTGNLKAFIVSYGQLWIFQGVMEQVGAATVSCPMKSWRLHFSNYSASTLSTNTVSFQIHCTKSVILLSSEKDKGLQALLVTSQVIWKQILL